MHGCDGDGSVLQGRGRAGVLVVELGQHLAGRLDVAEGIDIGGIGASEAAKADGIEGVGILLDEREPGTAPSGDDAEGVVVVGLPDDIDFGGVPFGLF